jgi:hypothetical protein
MMQRSKGDVKTETEFGVMNLQAKGHQELPAHRELRERHRTVFPPQLLEEHDMTP